MEFDLFLVSAVYWGCILIVFIWLSRRLSALKKRLADLEKGRQLKSKSSTPTSSSSS